MPSHLDNSINFVTFPINEQNLFKINIILAIFVLKYYIQKLGTPTELFFSQSLSCHFYCVLRCCSQRCVVCIHSVLFSRSLSSPLLGFTVTVFFQASPWKSRKIWGLENQLSLFHSRRSCTRLCVCIQTSRLRAVQSGIFVPTVRFRISMYPSLEMQK